MVVLAQPRGGAASRHSTSEAGVRVAVAVTYADPISYSDRLAYSNAVTDTYSLAYADPFTCANSVNDADTTSNNGRSQPPNSFIDIASTNSQG